MTFIHIWTCEFQDDADIYKEQLKQSDENRSLCKLFISWDTVYKFITYIIGHNPLQMYSISLCLVFWAGVRGNPLGGGGTVLSW